MSEIQEIDVYILPNGEVKIEVRGVKGKKCLALTKDLENLLGGAIENREFTDEFNNNEQELDQDMQQKQH
jgi:hypothetical protein